MGHIEIDLFVSVSNEELPEALLDFVEVACKKSEYEPT